MSQFNLTAEEDLLVLGAIRARAAQYLSSQGVNDPALDALVDKIQSQFTPVAIEEAPVEDEAPEDKAALAAFMDGVPHEQFTHDDDKVVDDE